ncbi:hypothetical protein ACSDQ9_03515 [Aestuariimicrobium soli]|uniref:hypothetical protein n=1 Tax=Aestuariimicrobium soli TaxID=2035834 RepID=UPI003EB9B005
MTQAPHPVRPTVGRGWALLAVLVLVGWGYLASCLGVVANELVQRRSELNPVLLVAQWFQQMVFATILLAVAATSLRRLGLTVVALLAGLVELGALGGFLALHVADVSVSAGVLRPDQLAENLVVVGLAVVGVVVSLAGRTRVWPPTATVGVLLAGLAMVLVHFHDQLLVLIGWSREAPPVTGPLLSAMVPLAIVLIGVAVSLRRWPVAAAALITLVVPLVPAIGDSLGRFPTVAPVWLVFRALVLVKVVALLAAAAACVGLAVALRGQRAGRSSSS